MQTSTLSVAQITEATNPQFLHSIEEDVFAIYVRLKNTLDKGVSAEEAPLYQAALEACDQAKEALLNFQK